MLADKIKQAKQVNKKPDPGHFSLDEKELNWNHCRETFAKSFTEKEKGIYFSHNKDQENNVIAFIEKTEEILEKAACQNISKSIFFKTNFNFATWTEPAEFWKECPVKRSLFTLLIRCGLSYDFENYEKALFENHYSTKVTRHALQRFFYGFTKFNFEKNDCFEGIGKGWVSYFANKNVELICEKLTLPENISNFKFLFGEKVLWN